MFTGTESEVLGHFGGVQPFQQPHSLSKISARG
jgi:hypothetical protein